MLQNTREFNELNPSNPIAVTTPSSMHLTKQEHIP
jgi:hypothetical protein